MIERRGASLRESIFRKGQVDQFDEDLLGIEVLLWLIDNKGTIVVLINGQIEQQQDDATRTGGELLDLQVVVLDAIGDRDVRRVVQPLRDAFSPCPPLLAIERAFGIRWGLAQPSPNS